MNQNILYLTYDGLSDPLGQSQILPYLEGLAEKGHVITVISFEKEDNLKIQSSKLKVIPLKYHKSPPVLSTLYDLYCLRKEVKKVLRNQKIDIIHCRSYLTSLVGLWAKRRFGVKFIFDMRGFWADERVEGGIWNINNPLFRWIYSFFKGKEKQFILEADSVISLTNNAKREIESWKIKSLIVNGRDVFVGEKIVVIPTCADLDHFSMKNVDKIHSDDLRKKLGIQREDKVLLYLGSLGTWYMLKEMLDFFDVFRAQVRKSKGNYKFLFVTRDHEVLKRAIEGRNYFYDEIIATASSRLDVPNFISVCDASIFFIIPTYSKKASAATKMAEILAMGKPIITNSGWGDVNEIINDNNGVLINNFDGISYQQSMQRIMDLSKVDPLSIRQTTVALFSLNKGIEAYHNIYMKLGEDMAK